MRRLLVALFCFILPSLALAQGTAELHPCTAEQGCTLQVPFNSMGINDYGGINTNSTLGYQYNGKPFLNTTYPTSNSALGLFAGQFSGASALSTTQFATGFGAYTFESLPGSTIVEGTCAGMSACISELSGSGIVGVGAGAGSSMTTQGGWVAVGDTAMRDVWDSGGSIAIGNGAYTDGAGTNPNLVIGQLALWGNASTITMAGSNTTGDILTFTFTTAATACATAPATSNCVTGNFPVVVNYTVISGDTTPTILAGHLATALNSGSAGAINYLLGDGIQEGLHNLYAMNFSIADATNHPTVIKGHYPSSWQISIAYSCSGTCGETATVTNGMTAQSNVLIGNGVFGYFGATTANYNVVIGYQAANTFVTTASNNTLVGYQAAQKLSTGTYNTGFGFNVFASGLTTGAGNIAMGGYAGYGITNGNNNIVVSGEAVSGQGCITSGSGNIELGNGVCVQSPTANTQMSIQNIIYGTLNAGTAATVSTGQIGIANTAPTATFTLGDAGGTSTDGAHMAVVQTTAPTVTNATLDTHASDFGGTMTLTAANPVLTFHVAFATIPHCQVTSPTGTSATYTAATGTLTITGGASSNQYTYMCVQ